MLEAEAGRLRGVEKFGRFGFKTDWLQKKQLLATTDLSVSEVRQAVGFCDQSYFGLVFRGFFHLTPLQYK